MKQSERVVIVALADDARRAGFTSPHLDRLERIALAGTQPIQSRPKVKQDPPELVEAKKVVKWRSGGNCEARIVGVCLGRATNVHHRSGRGFDGCHDPRLLLHVCGQGNASGCHGYIEQNGTWAKKHGLRLTWGTPAAEAPEPTVAADPGENEGREVTG